MLKTLQVNDQLLWWVDEQISLKCLRSVFFLRFYRDLVKFVYFSHIYLRCTAHRDIGCFYRKVDLPWMRSAYILQEMYHQSSLAVWARRTRTVTIDRLHH